MEPLSFINGIFPVYAMWQPGFCLEAIRASYAYIVDGRGWSIYKKNGVSTSVIKVESVSGLAALEQKILFTANKLPLELIRQVAAFFSWVYAQHRSEAAGYLFYCASSGQWCYEVPAQTVAHAAVSYDKAPKKGEGWVLAGTIHSHADFSAFHSGVDDRDEVFFDGVHITIGNVNTVPTYSCSVVVQGCREVLEPAVLIDGFAPADQVPEAWKGAIKMKAPQISGEPFAARAKVLYESYFSGSISEGDYKKSLLEIEKEAEEARQSSLARKTPWSYGNPAGFSSGLGGKDDEPRSSSLDQNSVEKEELPYSAMLNKKGKGKKGKNHK